MQVTVEVTVQATVEITILVAEARVPAETDNHLQVQMMRQAMADKVPKSILMVTTITGQAAELHLVIPAALEQVTAA